MGNFRNFRIVFSSVALSWGVAVFVRFLMPRALGPEILGDYGTADAWTAMLGTLAGWGFSQWISVNFATGKSDHRDGTSIVHAQLLLGSAGFCIVLLSAWLSSYSMRVLGFMALFSLSVIANQLAESASRMAEAAGLFDKVARIANPLRVAGGVMSATALMSAYLRYLSPVDAAFCVACAGVAVESTRAILTLRLSCVPIFCRSQFLRGFFISKEAFVLFVLSATPVFFSRVPQIILSKIPSAGSVVPTSMAELGVLTAAMSITIPLGVLVLGIQRVLMPALARSVEEGAIKFGVVFSDTATVVMIVVGVAAATLITCGNLVVTHLFGSAFDASRSVLNVTLLTVVLQYGSLLVVASAVVWRKERLAVVASLLAFPFNIGILLVLLRRGICSSGAEAVAWAAFVYELLVLLFVIYRMRGLFIIAPRARLAFVWAIILASTTAVVARQTSGWTFSQQVGIIGFTAVMTTLLSLLFFGKILFAIFRSWRVT